MILTFNKSINAGKEYSIKIIQKNIFKKKPNDKKSLNEEEEPQERCSPPRRVFLKNKGR